MIVVVSVARISCVMLSVSETSFESKSSPYVGPSLSLPVYASLRDRQDDASYFLCSNDKESNIIDNQYNNDNVSLLSVLTTYVS